MDNFIVSARKYRPATFHSVVGQQSVTTTLKNAIRNKHLAHAYLFHGPRGVGKTTCARIFAKTLNCLSITDDYEPCNTCESCNSFNSSRSYNIHELDAASNNSVEDIRSLIEQVRVPPQIGKYSVYIIDEVHMLSSSAFNAFLKTLEEPPEHAIFILATTEKHKIIPTILSRCQIFNFNRIRVEDAAQHLAYVAKGEGVEAEPDALVVIAQKADGAMRDALSYFDQIVSFSGSKMTYQDVITNLNVLDYDYYFNLTDAVLEGNYTQALLIFNNVLTNGFDGHHFAGGLSSHFRDLLVCTDASTLELLEVGANIKERYKTQSVKCSPLFLLKALDITQTADTSYKMSNNPRLHIELALLKLSSLNSELVAMAQQPVQQAAKAVVQQPVVQQTTQISSPEPIKTTTAPVTPTAVSKPVETTPAAQSTTSRTKTISIKGFTKEKDKTDTEQTVEEPEQKYESSSFTQEQLEAVWLSFAGKVDSPRLASMLRNHKPVLKSDSLIDLFLSNELQQQQIITVKPQMITFLRTQLKNSAIQLNMIIDESKVDKKPYTNEEKLEFLKNKNPELLNLQKSLNLEF